MPSKFNTEFNYRYQVVGETPWEKIKTLQGFLEGRIQAGMLEEASLLKQKAIRLKLKHLQNGGNGLEHEILELKSEVIENEASHIIQKEAYDLNRAEIVILKKLLKELLVIAEPTRIKGYSNEEMYEANSVNEFTVALGKEIQSEIIANGRPSPAKIRTAMRNPQTWNALKAVGMIPKESKILTSNINSQLKLELKGVEDEPV
jgi:hypothetical protein